MNVPTATKKHRKINRAALAVMQLKRAVDTDAHTNKRAAIARITKTLPGLSVGQLLSLVTTVNEMSEANQ